MRRLAPPPLLDELSLDGLFAAYAYPADPAAGTWVRANMVTSLDGAAQADGLSAGLSSPADRRVFRVLRSLADVIVAGAGTVTAEGYRAVQPSETYADRRLAAGMPATATIAVVSRSLDLDPASGLFAGPARTVVLTVAGAPPERLRALGDVADVALCGQDDVDIAAALQALAARGLRRVLCEGGPRLLGQVAAAGRLDELCLTVTPQLRSGDAGRAVVGPSLTPPTPMTLAHLLEEDGTLLQRWVRWEA